MSDYQAVYEKLFVGNLTRYSSLKTQIRRCVDQVLENPYTQTEFLGDVSGKLNLKGSVQNSVSSFKSQQISEL